MRFAALAALALASLTAAVHAQPVVYAPAYGYGYGPLPPPPMPAPDPVLAHRLSIGLEVGASALAGPHANDQVTFGGGMFTVGVRVTRHLELNGELGGGGGSDDSDVRGASLSLGLVGMRYHVNPASRWCWFLDAGTGIGNIRYDDGTGGGPRLAAYLGGGIEHRTERMSISLELRSVALSQSTTAYDAQPGAIERTIEPTPTTSDPSSSRNGVQVFGGISFFL